MRFPSLAVGCALLASCLPDNSVQATQGGTFQVVEQMTTNACGPQAVALSATATFQVVLGTSSTQAVWQVSGQSAVSGQYTLGSRSFQFSATSSNMLRDAVPATGQAACVMVENDQIAGSLTGGPLPTLGGDAAVVDAWGWDVAMAVPASLDGGILVNPDAGMPAFAASESIVFGPSQTSDCSDFVGANQGQYLTLPCQIVYTLSGNM